MRFLLNIFLTEIRLNLTFRTVLANAYAFRLLKLSFLFWRFKTMTKAELLSAVSAKVEGMTKKQTADVVDAVFASLSEAICKDGGARFSYPGFGTFTVKERAARDGRNPRTNEPIKIAASKTVSFKAAPKLKDILNGAKAAKKDVKKVDAKKDAKKACKKGCKK
jgi:DNA-binding protein HU-beta